MSAKRTSSALIASLIVHLVIVLIIAAYLVTQTQPFKDLVGLEVLEAEQPAQPKVRKSIVKPVEKCCLRCRPLRPPALLMGWMAEKTGVKGRVVGRTLYLDDRRL